MNPVEGKDYVLQIRVKNGPMLRAMRAAGFTTAAALFRATGVRQETIGGFLNLTEAPQDQAGEWKQAVLAIAVALRTAPPALFPPQHFRDPLPVNRAETEISLDELAGLIAPDGNPEAALEAEQGRRALYRALARLPERQRRVIDARFGLDGPPQTLKAVGLTGGVEGAAVTNDAIRAVEGKALNRLRGDFALQRDLGKKILGD